MSSMPTSDTFTKTPLTRPLSRIRPRTSASPPWAGLWTPPPPSPSRTRALDLGLGVALVRVVVRVLVGDLGRRLLLLHRLLVGLDDLAVADLAAPALEFLASDEGVHHDVAAEVLELQSRTPADGPPEISG